MPASRSRGVSIPDSPSISKSHHNQLFPTATDAGSAIISILNSTLKCERANSFPKNECPREAPAGLGDSASPFDSSSCPSWSNTSGNTPAGNATNDHLGDSGTGNAGSSDDQGLDIEFPMDTFGDPTKIEQEGVSFACPYRKHSRHFHTAAKFPECAGTSFEPSYRGITELKRHIKRCHGFPEKVFRSMRL